MPSFGLSWKARFASMWLGCVLVLFGAVASADDWPMYRHDRTLTAASDEKLPLPLEQIWSFQSRQSRDPKAPVFTGDLINELVQDNTRYTLPITAAGDSLFFTSAVDGRVVCLNAATGEKRWEFIAGSAVNRAPTISGGKVYVGSDDGYAYCLKASDGSVVWKVKAAPLDRWHFSFDQLASIWGVRSDVVVDKGTAYFGAGNFPHDGTFLYAVNAETGERVWRNDTCCESNIMYPLAPAGYLYVSDTCVYVPMEFKNYRFANILAFFRSDGSYHTWGSGDLPNYGKGAFPPVIGAIKNGVRYEPNSAVPTAPDSKPLWTTTDKDDCQFDEGMIHGMTPFVRGCPPGCDLEGAPIIYAGGHVYYVGFKRNADGKVNSGEVIARDAKTGRKDWSAQIGGFPVQVIAANGRLFVTTRTGQIYAFGAKGSAARGTITEATKENLPGSDSFAASAENIVKESKVSIGYALVLDCETGGLALELAKRTERGLRICAVFHDEKKADAARKLFTDAGLHIQRVFVWYQAPGTALPYPNCFADLVVSESAASGGALPKPEEYERHLKPLCGVALFGGPKQDAKAVADWAAATKEKDWTIDGPWAKRVRGRLEDAGQWSCADGDAGNTMCSQDGALKGPLGTYWYGRPFSWRDNGDMGGRPNILAEGVFLVHDRQGRTLAYDAYTGQLLWSKDQSDTDTFATHGGIYLRYLEVIDRLDPRTGKVIQKYTPPNGGKWDRMEFEADGKTMFAVTGGETYAADAETGNVLWHKNIGNWTAISDGRIYVMGGEVTPEMRAKALADMKVCLEKQEQTDLIKEFLAKLDKHGVGAMTAYDAKTGDKLYTVGVDSTNAGGGAVISYSSGGGRDQQNPFVGGTTMAHGGMVVFATSAVGADKIWATWPGGGYRARGACAYDGKTGKLAWFRFANCRAIPCVTDDIVITEPFAWDLKTGEPKTRIHPITGEPAEWSFCRYEKQCGVYCASRWFIFGRSRGIGYHDILRDRGLYIYLNSRASCGVDTSSGCGMMVKPPGAIDCRCETSMPFTVALGQVPNEPPEPQLFSQRGPILPVKHLYLDMGAMGDRRDDQGNLWMTPRGTGHFLIMGNNAAVDLYKDENPQKDVPPKNGYAAQRSSMFTPIKNTDTPFVFATALVGIKKLTVPVTDKGRLNFKVSLGFSALPGDKVGQRVFDVILNGKTVLSNFDIMKETGEPDKAVWKEFPLSTDKDFVLEFKAKAGDQPTKEQMPLINGVKVLRQD